MLILQIQHNHNNNKMNKNQLIFNKLLNKITVKFLNLLIIF